MATAGRILVVEDDAALRELLVGALREAGHVVEGAADARRALELLQRHPMELVLTDKNLPGIDGHTLINEVWMRHPQVGAVMVTGHRSSESEERARQQHVLAYLEKPLYDLQAVRDVVDAALLRQRERVQGMPTPRR
jgi:two-component system response regulator FlrC